MQAEPPPGWTTARLAEIVDTRGITYGVVQPGKPTNHGVPMLRVVDLRDGNVDESSPFRIDPAVAESHQRSQLQGGEVLISLVGSVGIVAIAPPSLAGWNVARAVGVVPVAEYGANRWVAYCLRSPPVQRSLAAHFNTTVQTTLNLRDLSACEIPWPARAEREAIIGILGALDDKIESNRRVSQLLAQTLALAATPARGARTPLAQVAEFRNGGAITKFANGAGRPIVRIRELRQGLSVDTPSTDAEIKPAHWITFGDLLFSWSATLMTHRWVDVDAVLNQHIFRVDPAEGLPTWLVEAWIEQHLPRFRRIAADKATTMGHIQRRHLAEVTVAVPGPEDLDELRRRYDPIDELRIGLLNEARTLLGLRHALLPKLVSGRIRVPITHDPTEALGTVAEEHAEQQEQSA